MNETTPAIQFLQEKGIPHRVFKHTGSIHSLEQAAEERGEQPEQVVRSIVFRLSEDNFVMVLVAGPGQIPWKALRRLLGESRMTMANEEELLTVTGYRPGTVTPFGLPQPMRILIDQQVLSQSEVSLGSGKHSVAIIMNPADIHSALENTEVVNLFD